jgi:hypothetical protein
MITIIYCSIEEVRLKVISINTLIRYFAVLGFITFVSHTCWAISIFKVCIFQFIKSFLVHQIRYYMHKSYLFLLKFK